MKTKHSSTPSDTPNPFLTQHPADVIGILSGLDRLRFKGSLPQLYYPRTMDAYLEVKKILFKDFKQFATDLTQRIKNAALHLAEVAGRPFRYLASCYTRKETLARELIHQDQLQDGLVGVFGCVESCRTYFLCGNRQTKKLEFKLQSGKCQHFYFYHLHPEFGLMHLRLQSWFPFQVQICINGREWLSRQMDRYQMNYAQKENCFTWISHLKGAQRLMDKQLELNWPEQLDWILRQNHPLAAEICQPLGLRYYWTTQESQYATDVIFKSSKPLSQIYPALVRHAITSFSSADVLRFLGHRVAAHRKVRGNFKGEVVSDLKERPEGIRVKHTPNANSLKMYDKQGSVLRSETTINQTRDFRVFREAQIGPHGRAKSDPTKKAWRILRRAWLTSNDEPRSPGPPILVTSPHSRPPPEKFLCSSGSTKFVNPFSETATVPEHSTPGRSKTAPCYRQSIAVSLKSTAFAIATFAPFFSKPRPTQRSKNAARPPSAENSLCSGLTV